MPRLIVTAGAALGLEHGRRNLTAKNPLAAGRAGQVIERHFALLEANPEIGRPYPEAPELREWLIPFGDSGYVVLYRHVPAEDALYVLAFRHQRKAGYCG